jgi:hypothetical protein
MDSDLTSAIRTIRGLRGLTQLSLNRQLLQVTVESTSLIDVNALYNLGSKCDR